MNLISFKEIIKYTVYSREGLFGKVDDVIVDGWQIVYFIIKHYFNLPVSKKGLLDVHYLKNVNIENMSFELDLPHDIMKKAVLFIAENESALVEAV